MGKFAFCTIVRALSFSEGANFIGTRPKNNIMLFTHRCLTL